MESINKSIPEIENVSPRDGLEACQDFLRGLLSTTGMSGYYDPKVPGLVSTRLVLQLVEAALNGLGNEPDLGPPRLGPFPAGEPDKFFFITQLREALGLPVGALPITPKQAWEEAMTVLDRRLP